MKISRIDVIGQNGNDGLHYCKCEVLVPLRTVKHASGSMGTKMCPDCKTRYPWDLDPGQRPLVTSSKDRGL
jgi:hypothetical protein